MTASFDLSDKVAAVTGASSGIGKACALALASAGAATVLVARGAEALRETAREIESAGGRAQCVSADLSGYHDLHTPAAQMAEPFGDPDILVNAAGVNFRQSWEDITPDSWDRTLGLNLSAPFFLARALAPAMRRRGWGRIINIASLQSVRAFENGIAYGASKGGIAQLTRALAEAWSRDGITVNAIAPGFFPTALTAPVFSDPGLERLHATRTAIGRNGRLEDLHGLTVFLAAPASDYVTGQVIFIDGGYTAK